MAEEQVPLISRDKNGVTVYDLSATASNDDWIRAGRLAREAAKGNESAKAKLRRMDRNPMMRQMPDSP